MAENAEQLLAALAAADDEIARLNGLLKQAHEEYESIQDRVFAYLDEQGTDQVRAPRTGLTVSITEREIPRIQDWDVLEKFVLRHKRLDLFQRRLSVEAWRTIMAERRDGTVPGTTVFTKRSLSVTRTAASKPPSRRVSKSTK